MTENTPKFDRKMIDCVLCFSLHRGEAALRKQLQIKNITVKENFWEKVSKNPRDAMVRKLVRKVESLQKPKKNFEIFEF